MIVLFRNMQIFFNMSFIVLRFVSWFEVVAGAEFWLNAVEHIFFSCVAGCIPTADTGRWWVWVSKCYDINWRRHQSEETACVHWTRQCIWISSGSRICVISLGSKICVISWASIVFLRNRVISNVSSRLSIWSQLPFFIISVNVIRFGTQHIHLITVINHHHTVPKK
jgi:hypothetical protein